MKRPLQVWAVAKRDTGDVVTIFALCPMHAAWVRDPDFVIPDGLVTFRVKAPSWVKMILRRCAERRRTCVECAMRLGRLPIVSDFGPLGILKSNELDREGATA